MAVFGCYSDSPSYLDQRDGGFRQTNYSSVFDIKYRTQTLTLGSNQALTARLTNEFGSNYSRSRVARHCGARRFRRCGSASEFQYCFLPSLSPQNDLFDFLRGLDPYGLRRLDGEFGNNLQQEINRQRFAPHGRAPDESQDRLSAHPPKAGLIDAMSVIDHSCWPRSWVCKKPHLGGCLRVILLPSLRDLRPVLLKQARGTMRWADDGNMPGSMQVGALEDNYDQVATVCQRLRLIGVLHWPPPALPAGR